MTGYINNILENDSGYEYGYISGDDGNSYYFDERDLNGRIKMTDFDRLDEVEFEALPSNNGRKYRKAKNVILEKLKGIEGRKNEEKNNHTEEDREEIVKFFKPGFAIHMDKKQAYAQFLKSNSEEGNVIDKLSQVLYISRIGHHIIDQRSIYQFCMAGVTKTFKQFIQGKYEFLIILSHFDSEDWQSKTLIVDREIRRRREIADRRPLVNF